MHEARDTSPEAVYGSLGGFAQQRLQLRKGHLDLKSGLYGGKKAFGRVQSYGLRRMRWRGLAKAALQVHLTAIAYNLRRGVTLLRTA